MLATHPIRCTRCLVLLEAPRIARFPRCNNCGEQLTCADAVETSAETELRQLQNWTHALTIQFDEVVIDVRWIRDHHVIIAEATRAQRPWHVQFAAFVIEWWWMLFFGLMVNSYYLLFVLVLNVIGWLWQSRRSRSNAAVIAEYQKRRCQVTGRGTAP